MDIIINAVMQDIPPTSQPIPHPGSFYLNILHALAYPLESPPLADLLRRLHGLEGDWLIASPICWEATHNDAMIIASGEPLNLTEQASKAWFDAFTASVASESCKTFFHDPYTWLIQMPNKPVVQAKPVHFLHHQSMMPQLDLMDHTLYWQRFFTENQMFFSAHSLNQQRNASLPINGLWIWGQGQLQLPSDTLLTCYDEASLPIANLLSTRVQRFDPSHRLKEGIIIAQQLTDPSLHDLKPQMQKQTVRWYWNNVAYSIKPKNWLQRFIERI